MEKKYKKILNDQGRIEYVEDINGRYTEKDFEGEFVLKGNLQKSEGLIRKEKETKSKNIIYFLVALVFVLIVAYMDKPSEPNNYYRDTRDTLDKEDCARMYPPVESEDVISDNILYLKCLNDNDLLGK